MAERIGSPLARTSVLFIHAVTASISRTHSQCQRRGLTPLTAGGPAELVSSSLENQKSQNRKVSKVALLAREAGLADRPDLATRRDRARKVVEPIGIEPMTSSLQS